MSEVTFTTTAACLNSFVKELVEGEFSYQDAVNLAEIALRGLSMQADPLVVRSKSVAA